MSSDQDYRAGYEQGWADAMNYLRRFTTELATPPMGAERAVMAAKVRHPEVDCPVCEAKSGDPCTALFNNTHALDKPHKERSQ